MGLAASQARLLTITARLADNELRSQTINNAKMRLATQSAQASDEYVSALNNSQMMFSNTTADGLAQKQALSFNALTEYSQYNTQYGIVNSAGQILVSEKEATIFKGCKNNLEKFLKAHNLEWETTFFNETSGDLAGKIQSFYGDGSNKFIGDLFAGKSNEFLKEIYLKSLSQDASIENLNYKAAAQRYYDEIVALYKNSVPELRTEILGLSSHEITEEQISNAIADLAKKGTSEYNGTTTAADVKKELIHGTQYPNIIPDSDDGGAKFSLDYLTNKTPNARNTNYLNKGYEDELRKVVTSLFDSKQKPGYAGLGNEWTEFARTDNGTGTYYKKGDNSTPTGTYNKGVTYTFGGDPSFTLTLGADKVETVSEWIDENDHSKGTYQYQKISATNQIELNWPEDYTAPNETALRSLFGITGYTGDGGKQVDNQLFNGSSINIQNVQKLMENIYQSNSDGITEYRYVDVNEGGDGDPKYQVVRIPIYNDAKKEDVYKNLTEWYLTYVLDTEAAFNALNYATGDQTENLVTLKNFKDTKTSFDIYGVTVSLPNDAKCLVDYDEMVKKKLTSYDMANDYMKSVLGTYMADKMLEVLGEPKYAWVDKNDPNNVGNADAKAQWLTNLFNRMQRGYKVLENGLAKSNEWLEYAFESGLVRMEQVDLSYNWVSMDYKSCSNIFEQTDNSAAVAKAEAKYNRAMNDIKQKDSMFDLQLKNIDTEHTSLQTEYDVVKGVMNKNIERTMKFNQNA